MSQLWQFYLQLPHPGLEQILVSLQITVIVIAFRLALKEAKDLTTIELHKIKNYHIANRHHGHHLHCQQVPCKRLGDQVGGIIRDI